MFEIPNNEEKVRLDILAVEGMRAWVREDGVAAIVRGLVERLRSDFLRWEEFDKVARVASHSRDGVIELMPTSDRATYSFKYVNGHPANPSKGLQTITAFGFLADVDCGYPVFCSEMTILTALRTAATSVLAAQTLARPDARTMAMIGAGSQAEFQALAFQEILGIDRIRVWDTDPAATAKLIRNLEGSGLEVTPVASGSEAVRGADIVTTCTADKANAHVLLDADVAPGMHVNAIGGDCPGKTELEAGILRRSEVFVEFEPQTRIEGEIQQLEPDFPVVELWQVLAGRTPGRTCSEQITVFDSVGFALADFTALTYARAAAGAHVRRGGLDLIAEADDPKDLFSLVDARQLAAQAVAT